MSLTYVVLFGHPMPRLTKLQKDVVSLTSGSDSLFLGSSDGSVRILSRALKVVRTFYAADAPDASITHLRQMPNTPFLVTISENLSTDPSLKVWALDKIEKKTGLPRCLCTIGVQNGRRQFPVWAKTSFCQSFAESCRCRPLWS